MSNKKGEYPEYKETDLRQRNTQIARSKVQNELAIQDPNAESRGKKRVRSQSSQ